MSDYISRESVLNTIEDMDKALDTGRTVEEYKALLIECIKALPSRDSITELEKIKSEIKKLAFAYDDLSPDKELVVDLDNIEEVFNEHISEPKGETE